MKTKLKAGSSKFDLAIRIARHLLTLPPGGWPETRQAERDLDDALPGNMTTDQIIPIALRGMVHIHPDRKADLRVHARRYTMRDAERLFPALR